MVMTEDERKLTAYHEAGHAIVALNIAESDPIHKATIIPRGRALGMVMRLPDKDRVSVSRVKLEADLSVAAGGRLAEEIIFGHEKITTGASSDINQVTKIARLMVVEWGMSDALGFLSYAENAQEVFLGHSSGNSGNLSDTTSRVIDGEIRAIVDRTYDRARKIIEHNLKELELLAQNLLEHETLTGADIKKILDGEKLEKTKKAPVVSLSKKSQMPSSDDAAPAPTTSKPSRRKPREKKSSPK
jgi:cell division protease FtsH